MSLPIMENGWHWCEFCQTPHTSSSCFHPGAARYYELKQHLADCEAERDDALAKVKRLEKAGDAMYKKLYGCWETESNLKETKAWQKVRDAK